jgi:endonuclease I
VIPLGSGDIYEALMTLDDGSMYFNTTDANNTVRLLLKEDFVPKIPFSGNAWQKEWIWPKNRGICEDLLNCTGKDLSDLHNIRPTSKLSKAVRTSKYFAGCSLLRNGGNCMEPAEDGADSTCSCNRAYQPPESERGEIARTLLYMDVRYDGTDDTADLRLADCPFNAPFDFAYLSQMLLWNEQYLPTEREKKRNEMVCTDFQGNRNPFVDYPELASVIFGDPLPDPAPDRENYETCDLLTTNAPTNSPNECDMILPGDVVVFMINSYGGPSQVAFWNYEDLPGDLDLFLTDLSWSETELDFLSGASADDGTLKVCHCHFSRIS